MKTEEEREIEKRFEKRLSQYLDKDILVKLKKGETLIDEDLKTEDYEEFRKENLPKSFSIYEKACYYSEKLLKISPDKKSYKKIAKALEESHINATPVGAQTFGLFIVAIIAYYFLQKVPIILQNRHKAKANDQVILGIFYIVSFMRFNPNFELATAFAAEYVGPPLSLDFKRILWKLNNQEYPNINRAFDDYLDGWKKINLEFLESIYLIESSLYESNEITRISLLDKALDIILQGNYEKMLHFAQQLKSRVSTFNMLGIVLPILALIILPLAASFGDPKNVWEFSLILYSLIIPIIILGIGSNLTVGKPGSVNSIKSRKFRNKKEMKEYTYIEIKLGKKSIYVNPLTYSILLLITFAFIIALPLYLYYSSSNYADILNNLPLTKLSNDKFMLFKQVGSGVKYNFGPYGFYPGILSLILITGVGLSLGYYFYNKYKRLIKVRDKTKNLEKEFPTATFQLGNRVGEGISIELAFGDVANNLKDTEAGKFFSKIDKNIKFNGMSVEKAIFDNERGAINDYPSDIIKSSMKMLIKTLNQGPEIVSKNLINLSKYLTEIHMAHERLIDLLAESLSSMKSQKSFLGPVISGIVVAIVSLITTIMGNLNKSVSNIGNNTAASGGLGSLSSAGSILGDSIPTSLFQLPVGIYLIILIIVLTYIVNDLENGNDPILKKFEIGKSLVSTMKKYFLVTLIGIIIFSILGLSFINTI